MENKMHRASGLSADTEFDLLGIKLLTTLRALHADIQAKRIQFAYTPMPAAERRELLRLQQALGQFDQAINALRGTVAQKGHITVENKLYPGQPGASSRTRQRLSQQQLATIKRSNDQAMQARAQEDTRQSSENARFVADTDQKLAAIAARRQTRGY